MIINLNKKFAFLCPYCSEICSNDLSLFSVSNGHGAALICADDDCGEKCVTISKKGNKYAFAVECPVCADTHHFTLSTETILNKSRLSLKCPVSDIDILMIGNDDNLTDIFEDSLDEHSDLLDSQTSETILMSMIEVLEKMSLKGNISCICGNDRIDVSANENCIYFSCPKCGRTKEIQVNEKNLALLWSAGSLVIK